MTTETLTHLVLAPEGTTRAHLAELIRMQYPDVIQESTGAYRLEAHIVGFGPLHEVIPNWIGRPTDFDQPIDVRQFTPSLSSVLRLLSVDVAKRFPVIFSITTVKDRGEQPPYGIHHPDGLFNAFPTGLPQGAEERAVDLCIGLARQVRGAVAFADVGAVIIPNPENAIDVTVYSPYWLAPIELGAAIHQVAPSAKLATDPHEWHGPAVQAQWEQPLDPDSQLTDQEISGVQAAADQFDAAALARPDELDAYAYAITLGKRGAGGVIEIRATGEEEPVLALAGRDWAHNAVSYSIVWGPEDDEQLMHQHPSRTHIEARTQARALIKDLTRVIQETVSGVVVTAEGFVTSAEAL